MISQLTQIFSAVGANISDMINKSKKDCAYTIINTDSAITDELIEKISSVEGIWKVRAIY